MSGPVDPQIDPDVGSDARTAPSRATLLTVIGVGGALGTLARYELGVHLTTVGYGWSWATFIANLTGAFALGLLVALAARHARAPTTSAQHSVRASSAATRPSAPTSSRRSSASTTATPALPCSTSWPAWSAASPCPSPGSALGSRA